MRSTVVRKILSCALVMILLSPLSLFGADARGAMVYARGTAWVNGSNIPQSSAIFPGDLVQTRSDSLANINAPGSNVSIYADSLIKFEGAAVSLEHGGLKVATSNSLATHVGGVTITPAAGTATEFQVIDVDGTIHISANKGDLNVSDASGNAMLAAGQETTRTESSEEQENHKRRKKGPGGALPGAEGSLLDSRMAMYAGLAVVGGVTTWVLLQGDDPVSPSKPNGP
jgi:hypothetical protein